MSLHIGRSLENLYRVRVCGSGSNDETGVVVFVFAWGCSRPLGRRSNVHCNGPRGPAELRGCRPPWPQHPEGGKKELQFHGLIWNSLRLWTGKNALRMTLCSMTGTFSHPNHGGLRAWHPPYCGSQRQGPRITERARSHRAVAQMHHCWGGSPPSPQEGQTWVLTEGVVDGEVWLELVTGAHSHGRST